MHLEDAIDVIDYSKFEKEKYYFQQVTGSQVIVDTSNFIVKKIELKEPERVVPSLNGSFLVYVCMEGKAAIKLSDGTSYLLSKGETIFIPASMEDFVLAPLEGTPDILEVRMPQIADEPDSYLNYDEPEDEAHGSYKEASYSDEEIEDDQEDDIEDGLEL